MILSFKDTLTQAVAEGRAPKGFPTGLVRGAQRKLAMLNAARRLDDLKSPPGNKPRRSFRGSEGATCSPDQQPAPPFLRWTEGGAEDVEITGYHKEGVIF